MNQMIEDRKNMDVIPQRKRESNIKFNLTNKYSIKNGVGFVYLKILFIIKYHFLDLLKNIDAMDLCRIDYFYLASSHGYLDIVSYLFEIGCPWNEKCCNAASKFGHLECLKFLHEKGCPWNKFCCAHASFNGHLECLKYLRENGCPWNQSSWESASGVRLSSIST